MAQPLTDQDLAQVAAILVAGLVGQNGNGEIEEGDCVRASRQFGMMLERLRIDHGTTSGGETMTRSRQALSPGFDRP